MDDFIYQTQLEYYMQECFNLAKKALGRTSPNPVVGTLVLDKNGLVVGSGYHSEAGKDHAEVVALKMAGEKAKGGTLIVNLEPCSHHGKTPPCTDLILKSEIKEVVFSNYDSNELVNGKGEKILKEKGLKVISNVLKEEGEEVNKFFFKWIKTGEPWVTLKQGQTLNGALSSCDPNNKWITSNESKIKVHELRNQYDAVLVGASTVITDDPELTVRLIENGRNPIRILLDPKLKIPINAKVFNSSSSILWITEKNQKVNEEIKTFVEKNKHINLIFVSEDNNKRLNLKEILNKLGKLNILSVLVEAGSNLAHSFISDNLIDEYLLFITPKIFFGKNIESGNFLETKKIQLQSYSLRLHDHRVIGNDLMLSMRP